MKFKIFLEKSRKSNGEKFLPKTVKLYVSIIERFKFKFSNDLSKTIEEMNDIIKVNMNPYVRSAFKQYLIFLGLPEEDNRLMLLKKTKKRASALTSIRVLGEKSIPIKDLKLLYSQVDDEWKLIIGFLFDTAVRESEFLNVCWKDITFKNANNIGAEVRVFGKGGKFRTVYLSKKITTLLKNLRIGLNDLDKLFVFKMDDGKLYVRQEKALIDKMRKLTKKYLGKPYTIHAFRHTKAQDLANSGADVGGISNLLGHSNFSTTQIYIKSSSAISKNMYEKYSEEL